MQLVSNISRYKGIEENTPLGAPVSINHFADWEKVKVIYRDYTGDTKARNHPGAQSKPATVYTIQTGRNEFETMKVARDAENVYFYDKNVDPVRTFDGKNWMPILRDVDGATINGK